MEKPLKGAHEKSLLIDQHSLKSQLRFLTCGSVDDGKSTLIGRLLFDAKVLTHDQLESLRANSGGFASNPAKLDFSLLLDGLSAEREQGITIDVAYRFFTTVRRSFIVADCPGHEQYTRNMVTGASNCELAILLVDATKGILPQTRRHSLIASKLGIRNIVLAVNKMDLANWDQERFDSIVNDFDQFSVGLGFTEVTAIPLSGLLGANVVDRSQRMPWYQGPCLLEYLETVPSVDHETMDTPLRIIVQGSVINSLGRGDTYHRAITGFVAAGTATIGAAVRIMPSGRTTSISEILMPSDADNGVQVGRAITFTLAQETDCGRGSLVCAQSSAPQMADAFVADLVWMSEDPLLIGQRFWLKIGANTTVATVIAINHRLDINTGKLCQAESLELNGLGEVVIETTKPFAFEAYANNKALGGFVLVDRLSHATVAAGMIDRSTNIASENLHWQFTEIDAEARADLKGQFPLVVWLTGLSGAGKSTIANLAEKRLFELGYHTYLLEGDNLRYGLNRDLAFSPEDRRENIRRAGEVARLMTDAGLIVIAAFISPFLADRAAIRQMMPTGRFLEVHVHVSLEEAERRDPKGLYRKARSGKLKGFTGIDSPYEPAVAPEMYIDTQALSAAEAADQIVAEILALQARKNSPTIPKTSSTDTP